MKPVLILLGAVVILGGFALVKFITTPAVEESKSESSKKATPTLPAIDRGVVDEVEITDPVAKQSLKLARRGETWVMPDRFDHPVTEAKVKELFESLVNIEKAAFIGSNPSLHPNYEVQDGKGKVLRIAGAGKNIVELIIGKQDSAGGLTYQNAGTFVRPVGKNEVFSHGARFQALLNVMPRVWLNTMFLPKDSADANALIEKTKKLTMEFDDVELGREPMPGAPVVTRTNERMRVVLECETVATPKPAEGAVGPEPKSNQPKKETERKWKLIEPESANSMEPYLPMVDTVVRQLLGGRFEDVKGKNPSDPAFGLDKPVVEVSVSFEDGTTRSLKLGALIPPEEGQQVTPGSSARYCNVVGSDFVVAIPEYLSRGFQKKPDDLKNPAQVAPPTPMEPPPGASGEIVLPDDAKKGDEVKKTPEGEKKSPEPPSDDKRK